MHLTLRLNKSLSQILKNKLKSPEVLSNLNNDELKVKIGLEIHARILSKTKIFCDANCFDLVNTPVNSNVSFFDAALPGTMPSLNRRCVDASLLTALALNCQINSMSFFERKHYFYADLPAGYQITQQKCPIALNGLFKYPVINPKTHKLTYKECKIMRIQLEHDSARTLQIDNLEFKLNDSQKLPRNSVLIDLNRAGMGLMEIVTGPDFEEAFDCYSFARELALVLRSIGTCDAQMGEGGFRVDVNVSVHQMDKSTNPPTVLPGVRVELKNLSSFNAILKGTEYEIRRQKELIRKKEPIRLETRTYDTTNGKTVSLRSKEDQYDYRFMPEPNLLPLIIHSKNLKPHGLKCQNNKELILSEEYLDNLEFYKNHADFCCDLDKVKEEFQNKVLPSQRRNYLVSKYSMTNENAFVFVANNLDHILNELVSTRNKELSHDVLRLYIRVLLTEYLNQVNENNDLDKIDFKVKCNKIESYVELIRNKLISRRISLTFFKKLFELKNIDKMAHELAQEENLFIIRDENLIKKTLEKLSEQNPKAINEYKNKEKKRTKIFDFFVGRVHKELRDVADPELVDHIVQTYLKSLL
ncbi:unnamed protein product [Brachionus calyciflorus]|uniref:Glutamyl-tRNA(Gln) amidotransferase subunit B, mitochondrial n=1 Tax=Brachionus calyciflorus TaxID=104777 RepID=A0A813NMQ2_9BILA|nr:unnamed protein product [Brachionus calyciflorus]